MTEAQCKDADIPVKTGKATMFGNAKTVIANGDRAFMKVVAHANTHKVLGAQFMCENATDMISQISEAVANGMTAEQLMYAMRPHPTFEESLSDALTDLISKFSG
jgi:dihydrolipoamide dehydrogenase